MVCNLMAAALTCWLLQLHLVLGHALCCCSLSQPLSVLVLTLGLQILHQTYIHQAQPSGAAPAVGILLLVPLLSIAAPPLCATGYHVHAANAGGTPQDCRQCKARHAGDQCLGRSPFKQAVQAGAPPGDYWSRHWWLSWLQRCCPWTLLAVQQSGHHQAHRLHHPAAAHLQMQRSQHPWAQPGAARLLPPDCRRRHDES